MEIDLEIPKKTTVDQLLEQAYEKFSLGDLKIAFDRCRLVKFSKASELIETSLDPRDGEKTLTTVLPWTYIDLLLEIRPEHIPFRQYATGGITFKVHKVEVDERDGRVEDYFLFHVSPPTSTVGQLCSLLAQVNKNYH